MARFRGTVQGNRGEASRLGHKPNGLRVQASTWHEHVVVNLYVDGNDTDCVAIMMQGKNTSWIMWQGPIAEIANMGHAGFVQRLAHDALEEEFK